MQTIEHEPAGENGQQPTPRNNWRKRLVIGGAAVAALAGLGVAGALSQDFGGRHPMGYGEGGAGMHHASYRHGAGFGFGGRGLGRILDRIDATDEQEDKLEAIMDQLHDDVRPVMRSFRDTREDIADLLGAATVDAAAVEAMRAERIAAVDDVSRKVSAALVQAAEVLTPEQRAKLKEHFEDRGRRGRW